MIAPGDAGECDIHLHFLFSFGVLAEKYSKAPGVQHHQDLGGNGYARLSGSAILPGFSSGAATYFTVLVTPLLLILLPS